MSSSSTSSPTPHLPIIITTTPELKCPLPIRHKSNLTSAPPITHQPRHSSAQSIHYVYTPAPDSPPNSTTPLFIETSVSSNQLGPKSPLLSTWSFSGGSQASLRASPVVETSYLVKSTDEGGVKTINKYVILHEIGRGVHGKVKLARHSDTHQLFAIKIVRKTVRTRRLGLNQSHLNGDTQSIQLEKIKREIAIMKKCVHPNIVQLIEVIDDPTSEKVYMVLEFMAGGEISWKKHQLDLGNSFPQLNGTSADPIPQIALSSSNSFPQVVGTDEPDSELSEDECRHIFRDVIVGLEYLHCQGIIHRDIKPANILRSGDGTAKLSDFGVSHFSHRQLKHEQKQLASKKKPRGGLSAISQVFYKPSKPKQASDDQDLELGKTAGSPAFFAPELCILDERPSVTKAIDVWALGVTLYCLVVGTCPFVAKTEFELFEVIPSQPVAFPNTVSMELQDLLTHLLDKDPKARYTLEQAKLHAWTTKDLGLAGASAWVSATNPVQYEPVQVTDADVQAAFTYGLLDRIRKQFRRLSSSFINLSRKKANSQSSLASAGTCTPRPLTAPCNPSYDRDGEKVDRLFRILNDSHQVESPKSSLIPHLMGVQNDSLSNIDMEESERRRQQTWESQYMDPSGVNEIQECDPMQEPGCQVTYGLDSCVHQDFGTG